MREATVVFLLFAALGIYQSAPSVTTGDAGELAAAAAVWGVPHAPGYPSFVVPAKAFGSLFALGDWAHRANLFSAVCAAAALALLGDALRRLGAGAAARLGAIMIFGLSPLWREQSAVAEVFAPLALVAAGLVWLSVAAGERLLQPGPAAALGLVFGLGLGAHQTLILVLPALLLAGRAAPGRLLPALGWAGAGAAAGFALHLTVPLRAVKSPPLDWGHAVSFDSFLRLLLRRDYGTFSLTVEGSRAFGPEEAWAQGARFFRFVWHDLGPAGAVLAALGALSAEPAGSRTPRTVFAVWIIAAGPAFLLLGRPGFDPQTEGALQRFYLLPLIGFVPFLASGISALGRLSPLLAWASVVVAATLTIPGAVSASRRDDFLARDYGRSILRTLPRGSVLVMDGGDDTFYSLAALTMASGLRADLELRDRGGVVFPGGYGPGFRALTKEAKEARRLETENRWFAEGRLYYSTLNDALLPGATLAPAGLLRRPVAPPSVYPEGAAAREITAVRLPRASPRYRDRALAAFLPYQRGVDAFARGDAAAGAAWLELAAQAAPDALWVVPTVSYALGVNGFRAVERRDWPAAEAAYRAGASVEPARAEPLTNLGVVLERAGRAAEAETVFREAISREPRSARAWAALGARLWGDGRWSDSAEAFAAAAALDPADAKSAAWAGEARRRAKGASGR